MVVQSSNGTYSLGNHTMDNFAVALSRPPGTNVQVVVNILPPKGLVLLTDASGIPSAAGTPWRDITNEVQVVALTNIVGGHFKLTFNGQTTAAISWDATAADVVAALGALSNLDPTDVSVTQTGTVYTITFIGTKAATNVVELTAALQPDATPTGSIAVQTTVGGGVSKAKAVQLTFTSSDWWVPQ